MRQHADYEVAWSCINSTPLTAPNMLSSNTATILVSLSSLLFCCLSTAITTCSSSHWNKHTSYREPNSSFQPTKDKNKDNTITLFHILQLAHGGYIVHSHTHLCKCYPSIIKQRYNWRHQIFTLFRKSGM